MLMKKVAVGIVYNHLGEVLIARRRVHEFGAGLWEFPGGKVEEGELVPDAVTRELEEEFGIVVRPNRELLNKQHDYGEFAVDLHFWQCEWLAGNVEAKEGHGWHWVAVADLGKYAFLEANAEVIELC